MIKLLIIIDKISGKELDIINDALELQNKDYLKGTDGELGISWDFQKRDLSDITWEDYFGNNYGVNRGWITAEVKKLVNQYGDKYDSVAYVIKDWTDKGNQGIWGWNLGAFYPWKSGYQVQLIRYHPNADWLYKTFLMELFHAINDFYYRKTNKRLEDFFEVTDFDMDIVHGEHIKYDSFKYIPVIRQMKDILIDLFAEDDMTKEQVEKLYALWGMNDPEGIEYWVGKTLNQLLDARIKDKLKELKKYE